MLMLNALVSNHALAKNDIDLQERKTRGYEPASIFMQKFRKKYRPRKFEQKLFNRKHKHIHSVNELNRKSGKKADV